jgi:anti-sigma regulatory factor (Ser/Thr protein kinase)
VDGLQPGAGGARHLALPRDLTAAARARESVARLLGEHHGSVQARESAQLVASELVTNALQHGEGAVELRLQVVDNFLRIEVVDQGRDQAPAVRQEAPGETGGWGLRIVDRLAAQWGVFEGTTHVWADVALS